MKFHYWHPPLRIRWKLILFMGVPVTLICCLVFGLGLFTMQRRAQWQTKQNGERMAQLFAARFDAQLSAVAQIGRSVASFLELHDRLSEEELHQLLASNVGQSTLIQGMAVVCEPHAYRTEQRLLAPYVYRDQGVIQHTDFSKIYGDYTTADMAWWIQPQELPRARWTEPYIDPRKSERPMCTYAASVKQDGQIIAVVLVDIALEALQGRAGLDELGADEFFIVSRKGTFISDQNPDLIMKRTIYDLADISARPELVELGRQMASGLRGFDEMPARDQEGVNWIFYAPIRSTGWSFAALVHRERAMSFVYSQTYYGLVALSVALVLIVVVIWVISRRITEPISLISAAVQQLAEGRLDVRVQGVRTRDEIGEFARTFNRMVADLSQHVAALTEQTAAREAVQSELRVARNIQNRLLPQRFPAFPDRREFDLYAVNDPVRTVAGDFYDYFLVDDSTLAVCIADVSGKGVPASLFMAVTSTLVRNLAPRCDTPGQVLFEANRQLLRDSEGAMFVTLLLGFYNIHTGEMRYANAAHPLPYLLAANQPPKQVGRSTGTVLGMVDDAGFEDDVTVIEPGSSLVFYTDGVPEARGPGGRFLDDEGFESILTRLQADSSPQQVCRHILSGVQLFQADTPPSDDITLLVLQRSGDQPSPSTAGHNPEHTSAAVR